MSPSNGDGGQTFVAWAVVGAGALLVFVLGVAIVVKASAPKAVAKDQFGDDLSPRPAFTWSVTGGGEVDSAGLFTAGSTPGGPYTVTAESGGVSGTAEVTVTTNQAPTVASAASATPNPVPGATTALSVLGADDGGESKLTYTWAATGKPPRAATYSVNGTNAARDTTATFAKAGDYTFEVTIEDEEGLTVTSQVAVTVSQTLTGIDVTPATATVSRLLTQQFAAEVPAEKAPVDVAVWEIEPRTVTDRIRLPGTVSAWEEVTVAAEIAGVAVSVAVDEGDEVEKDDVLCRIDASDYRAALDRATAGHGQAGAAVATAKAALKLAELQFRRIESLRGDGTVGQAEYDAAEAGLARARAGLGQAEAAVRQADAGVAQAELALRRTAVRAPFGGVVAKVSVTVGSLLSPGKAVARVVDIHKVRVSVGIPERDVLAVGNLDEIELTFQALPGRTVKGRRTYLGVEPEQRARTYRLELAVENPERLLRPGMFATADIVRGVHENAVVIPLFAVIPREKEKVVFVEDGGVAFGREVQIGILMGRKLSEAEVEITKGLEAGERLIVVGHRQVEDGDPVKVGEIPEPLKKVMKW